MKNETKNKMDDIPLIFLDVGHAYGAQGGVEANGIKEQNYNLLLQKDIMDIWSSRLTIDNVLARIPNMLQILGATGVYDPIPYSFIINNVESGVLCGTYAERKSTACEIGVSAYIQMHFNSGGGNYSLVGYNEDNKDYVEGSEKMANIFAEVLNEQLDPEDSGKLITEIKVEGCSDYSSDRYRQEIAYSLRSAPGASILIEPLFLDTEIHAEFMKTPEGYEQLLMIYIKALERIAKEVLNV